MPPHTNFDCTTIGLVVNPLFPYLGDNPDGMVTCTCCVSGVIEITFLHPNTLNCKPHLCLGEVGMVASYAYYTQVQGQLLITEKQLGALLYEPQSSTSIPMHQIHKETFEETNYVDYTYMIP